MSRIHAIFGAAFLATYAACAAPGSVLSTAAHAFEPGVAPQMSSAAVEVARIAAANGDSDYIMIDKYAGEIIMFRNGVPVVRGSALTGQNPADSLPPGALQTSFSRSPPFADKVTPAGRYTMSKQPDHTYGVTLDVNEIQGVDWDIAVHRIFLGFPQEHRDARLVSTNGQDKHITFGCIDVSNETMQQLVRYLPDEEATPVYIVPSNPAHIAAYFPVRGAGARASR